MKNRLLKSISILSLIITCWMVNPVETQAQCPMCRMTAESNLAQGGQEGQGLNNGILYMFAMPYILVGGIAFFWWRNKRQEKEVFMETIKD